MHSIWHVVSAWLMLMIIIKYDIELYSNTTLCTKWKKLHQYLGLVFSHFSSSQVFPPLFLLLLNIRFPLNQVPLKHQEDFILESRGSVALHLLRPAHVRSRVCVQSRRPSGPTHPELQSSGRCHVPPGIHHDSPKGSQASGGFPEPMPITSSSMRTPC